MTDPARALAIGELPAIGPAVVTLGVFDGVHDGHRAVLAATQRDAAELGATSVALVFDPPPDEVLRPGTVVPRLAPLAVNLSRIEAAGVARPLPMRFDGRLRELTAEEFLDALRPAVELRRLVMTQRSAFGRDRGGTAPRMQELGAHRGFAVRVVEAVEVDGAAISSTRVRTAIAEGEVGLARRLGVAPYLEGIVVAGDRRGRDLGFPTANLRFDYAPAMPSLGIYAGRLARSEGPVEPGQPALISIGTRPTFHEDGEVLAEVHLLDWEGDLYGSLLAVELVARLRDERRFSDVDALVAQMRRDAEMGRAALGMS